MHQCNATFILSCELNSCNLLLIFLNSSFNCPAWYKERILLVLIVCFKGSPLSISPTVSIAVGEFIISNGSYVKVHYYLLDTKI